MNHAEQTYNSNTSPEDLPAEVNGLRMTKQRRSVFSALLSDRTHPTANDVFMNVKESMPTISLATVYNCLEALVQHDAVRQVNFDREPSRYCPNLSEHCHFQDKKTGEIHDVTFRPDVSIADFLELPEGTMISDLEITIRGNFPSSPSSPSSAESSSNN